MTKLTGLLMIVAGVGTAAYVYPLIGSDSDKAQQQLADVAAISTAGSTDKKLSSSGAPILVVPRVISKDVASKDSQLVRPAPPAVAPLTSNIVTAAVPNTTTPVTAKPIEAPVPQLAKRAKADDEGRATLAREIQRELRRVGCFQGEPDGNWNTSTRQAMKTFIDRVNATLPTDEPDHILKTLVQGHPGNACGRSCPTGQSAAGDGRCLPTGVMAQAPFGKLVAAPEPANRPAAVAAAPVAATVQPAARPETNAPVTSPKAASSWETTVAASAPPAMAAIAAAASTIGRSSAASGDARQDTRSDPLPGRMAIGAPAAPKEASNADSVVTGGNGSKILVRPSQQVRAEPKLEQPEPQASEKSDKPRAGNTASSGDKPEPRRAAPQPTPRVAIYRAPPPPPRYVGAYTAPYRERPRFGPSIFRQNEAFAR